jgi:hypothetical protein
MEYWSAKLAHQWVCGIIYRAVRAEHLQNFAVIVADGDDVNDPLPAHASTIKSCSTVLGQSDHLCSQPACDEAGDERSILEVIDEEKGAAVSSATSLKAAVKASRYAIESTPSQMACVKSLSDLALVTEYARRVRDLDYVSRNLSHARGTSEVMLRQALSRAFDFWQ